MLGCRLLLNYQSTFIVIGYDVSKKRIKSLNKNDDYNKDIVFNKKKLNIFFTNNEDLIAKSNIYIITVPTPVNSLNQPDFSYLKKANETVGKNLKIGDIVVYESTVFPGYTDEMASKELEKYSNLKFNKDFFAGILLKELILAIKKEQYQKLQKLSQVQTIMH